jgi:hypothetical protein
LAPVSRGNAVDPTSQHRLIFVAEDYPRPNSCLLSSGLALAHLLLSVDEKEGIWVFLDKYDLSFLSSILFFFRIPSKPPSTVHQSNTCHSYSKTSTER